MFKRSLLIGVIAAAAVSGTASAHQTTGEMNSPIETFEDGSSIKAEVQGTFGPIRIVVDAEDGSLNLVFTFEDMSLGRRRIDTALTH